MRTHGNIDQWLDTFVVALVVAIVGIAAMAPHFDRQIPDAGVVVNVAAPACVPDTGDSRAPCLRTASVSR